MKKFVLIAAILASFATPASAQSAGTETLAENMRATVTECMGKAAYSGDTSTKMYKEDFDKSECVRVNFRALQTYVDAASACIMNPTAGKDGPCAAAKILEQGLIKTFRQPPKSAAR